MHELYIAESILKSTRESLPPEVLPAYVQEVRVQVGQLDAVIPETLSFIFDAIKASHGMSQAKLLIEQIEVRCRCRKCDHEFCLDLPLFICPICRSGQVEVLRGRGITLSRIIAQDPERKDHGDLRHS
jgi:hydrogenase nickel incorporation protein HypA/HybF